VNIVPPLTDLCGECFYLSKAYVNWPTYHTGFLLVLPTISYEGTLKPSSSLTEMSNVDHRLSSSLFSKAWAFVNVPTHVSTGLFIIHRSMHMLCSSYSTENSAGTLFTSNSMGRHSIPNLSAIIPKTLSIVILLLLSLWFY
jgi:hypothetical protein